MLRGPKIKLAIDLQKLDKYFPIDFHLQEGFDYDWIIDRDKYDEMAGLLKEYGIADDKITREFCFILLWIEKETQAGEERENLQGKFYRMQAELDSLNDYLMQKRITSITLHGDYKRNKPGEELTLRDDITIDRICDGIRSVFNDEFHHDKQRRKTKGLTAWQRRKMIKIRNNMLNYFTSVPELDKLSLEEQNYFIDQVSELAGMAKS
jgi:hypothetical protein